MGGDGGRSQAPAGAQPRPELTSQDLYSLQRETHVAIRDASIADPMKLSAPRWRVRGQEPDNAEDAEELELAARGILSREGGSDPTEQQVDTFKPLLLKARQGALADLSRAGATTRRATT